MVTPAADVWREPVYEATPLSPSAAHRWLACPASPAMSRGQPDTSSAAAREGTAIHRLARETLATPDRATHAYLDRDVAVEYRDADGRITHDTWTMGTTRVDLADRYVRYVRELADACDATPWVESRLDLTPVLGVPDVGGTVDALLVDPEHARLHIIDLKTGHRRVTAAENPQLRLYAAAGVAVASLVCEIKTVQMTISMPRHDSLDHEVLAVAELSAWVAEVRPIAARAAAMVHGGYDEDALAAQRHAGSHCQYCPARAVCPTLADDVMAAAESPAAQLPDDRLVVYWQGLPGVEAWVAAIRDETRRRLDRDGLPGLKQVAGRRGARRWTDPAAVAERLVAAGLDSDTMWAPRTLRSPAQGQKAWPADVYTALADCIEQPDGTPQIAAADDPRPAIASTRDDFAGD